MLFSASACPTGKFGDRCAGTCHCAERAPCDAVSGQCDNGCAKGWTGQQCAQTCLYGDNCEEPCPVNCAKNNCSHTDGSCRFGCQAGWLGGQCTIRELHSLLFY